MAVLSGGLVYTGTKTSVISAVSPVLIETPASFDLTIEST